MATAPKKKLISSDNDTEWSPVLAPDLIRSIFERLNFAEFHRAMSISLDWYSTAELCYRQNPTPWLILFSNYRHISCRLFDPLHDKTYVIRDLGFDFHRSCCLATSGSWLLMLDHRTDFYLLNLFTRERICLPTLEAIDGWQMKFERVGESDFLKTFTYREGYRSYSSGLSTKVVIENAVLWVDERSRDYLVVWSIECFFAYHKKGDNNKTWKVIQLKKNEECSDIVFRESKLYVLNPNLNITVFDFSSGSPNECASFTSQDIGLTLYPLSCFGHLVITLSGEVLLIKTRRYGIYSFDVYKMDPKSSKWREIYSLGNEAILLDLGTTIAAKDGFG
ncbi:unnamed protein product [Arabidopsis thaliana]|uniref:F-box/kelch-repeat protein n=2 Tax=Arabidopsis thaliana TaxID=3702 RepID=Q9LUW3_ARATH|nr:F-box/kelch-repeat protein [Arabidopsis thaliana]ABF59442.1 unknown protein [Arabidopsis thaliana]AEE76623.1 F-box/kelch-repeat protein [Arabidopsis thaliana]BAB01772.1 unnamed protein product [Arabidopsis thaliana]|eukprot:NP_001118675.1 F-box/kelch-repeat protein [Arabidopsis thaliana]